MSPLQTNPTPPLRSDEELQQITVGERRPHNAPIILVDYDPDWPRMFEREAARIRSALGDKALQIEHVGSTSVSRLCAKPIIDILLVVADSADEPAYVPALEAAGCTLRIRELDWYEHRLLKDPGEAVNLHVFSTGAGEIERMLRFRDRLRSSPADRDRYAAEKRKLARRRWKHVQHYAAAKTAVIQEIMNRAE